MAGEAAVPAPAPVECDIVMKGGITSGVVYPPAVVALAKRFRFRNVGGTSAGAIAAAVTAAAEYGRQAKQGTAFSGLAEIPQWLAAQNRLLGLFCPSPRTAPIFTLLTRMLGSPRGQNKLVASLAAVLSWNPLLLAAASTAAAVLILLGLATQHWWLLALAVFAVPLFLLAASLWLLFECLANEVPKNFYGICTGLDPRNPNDPTVLTSWLAQVIDSLAGVGERKEPLTFGDLWGGRSTEAAAAPTPDSRQDASTREREREARNINLETITTNLTHGRPYRFPFDTQVFYFNPDELRRLFPPRVVEHLIAKRRLPKDDDEAARMKAALPLLPFPEAGDLPIVVAARMSLSFPLLISAVPLYAVDWSLPDNEANRTAPTFERCWFSDGGLCSNFPIHLFDGPIPARPTFAIDLDSFPAARPESATDQCANVWMPENNRGGTLETWTRFGAAKPDLGGFAAAIFNALQNWQDTTQSLVPGFRDRIVHVYLSPEEGGLNLNMDSGVLTKLAARGGCAGETLIAHFDAPNPPSCGHGMEQPTNWDNHRIVRLRTAMALLENWLRRFSKVYTPDYGTLIGRASGVPPCSYPWEDDAQRSYAVSATADLVATSSRWEATGQTFSAGAPKPEPDLVTRPHS